MPVRFSFNIDGLLIDTQREATVHGVIWIGNWQLAIVADSPYSLNWQLATGNSCQFDFFKTKAFYIHTQPFTEYSESATGNWQQLPIHHIAWTGNWQLAIDASSIFLQYWWSTYRYTARGNRSRRNLNWQLATGNSCRFAIQFELATGNWQQLPVRFLPTIKA